MTYPDVWNDIYPLLYIMTICIAKDAWSPIGPDLYVGQAHIGKLPIYWPTLRDGHQSINRNFDIIRNVNPWLINRGWLIVVVPLNNSTKGYWNGISPSHKQPFGFLNQGLTLPIVRIADSHMGWRTMEDHMTSYDHIPSLDQCTYNW